MSDELVEHLCKITRLDRSEAKRVIEEVVAFYQESPESFVSRRHRELQLGGYSNSQIYTLLKLELGMRCFAAPALSERQIRRMIYG